MSTTLMYVSKGMLLNLRSNLTAIGLPSLHFCVVVYGRCFILRQQSIFDHCNNLLWPCSSFVGKFTIPLESLIRKRPHVSIQHLIKRLNFCSSDSLENA